MIFFSFVLILWIAKSIQYFYRRKGEKINEKNLFLTKNSFIFLKNIKIFCKNDLKLKAKKFILTVWIFHFSFYILISMGKEITTHFFK